MELVIRYILFLAAIDFILTLFWLYRWQSSSFLKKFKRRIPIKLIEANPIIRHGIEKFGLYPGATLGYAFIFMIQILLARLRNIDTWVWLEIGAIGLSWFIVAVLFGAIVSHMKNNVETDNDHIIKMTKAYNEEVNKNAKREKTH